MSAYLHVMFNVVVPISIVCLAGMMLQSFRKTDTGPLVDVSLFILAPSLVLVSLDASQRSLLSMVQVIEFTLLHTFGCWMVAKLSGRALRLGQDQSSSLTLTTLFGNANNYGLPLLLLAYGTKGFAIGIDYVILQVILVNSVGMYIASRANVTPRQAVIRIAQTPLIWSVVAGMGLYVLHIALPSGITNGLHLLGDAYAAVVLLVLGIQLRNTSLRGMGRPAVWAGIALRMILVPLLAKATLLLLGVHGLLASVLFVQSSMPAAVNTAVLARKYGGDLDMVSLTILITTVASFVTLPLFIHISSP